MTPETSTPARTATPIASQPPDRHRPRGRRGGPLHAAVGDQLPDDPLRAIDWNREADALVTAVAGSDGCVDADYFAVELTNGPPLLPGLIAASVWISRPRRILSIPRPLPLMIPALTVASSSNGLPMAITQSPISN